MIADVSFSTESLAIIGALMASLVGAISMLFKMLIAAKDKQLVEMKTQRDSYRAIATTGIATIKNATDELLRLRGDSARVDIKPVVPEHSSPATTLQHITAEIATMRADLVACELAINGTQDAEE